LYLAHLDLNGPRLLGLGLWQANGQYAVLGVGLDLRLIDIRRQTEAAGKAAVKGLNPVMFLLVFTGLQAALTADRDDTLVYRDIDIFLLDLG